MSSQFPNQPNDSEFWKWFFQVEDMSETPLREDEAFEIVSKNTLTGEKRTYKGIRLKRTLRKKAS